MYQTNNNEFLNWKDLDETIHKLSKKIFWHYGTIPRWGFIYLQSYLHIFRESSEQSDSESIFKILNIQIFDKNKDQNVIGLSMDNSNFNKGIKKSNSKAVLDKYAYICSVTFLRQSLLHSTI